jgi:hypothetical protein
VKSRPRIVGARNPGVADGFADPQAVTGTFHDLQSL